MSAPQTFFKVKVHPDSKENKIIRKSADAFVIFVRSEAERGQANKSALSLLADTLQVKAQALHIVKGAHSPNKIVSLRQGS